jgi:di/tricarboxylate transporter
MARQSITRRPLQQAPVPPPPPPSGDHPHSSGMSASHDDRIDMQVLGLPVPDRDDKDHPLSSTEADDVSKADVFDNDSMGRSDISLNFPDGDFPRKPSAIDNFNALRADNGDSAAVAARILTLRLLRKYWLPLATLIFCAVALALLGALVFEPLSWKAWFAFADVSVVIALLLIETIDIEVMMLVALVVMLAFQTVSVKDSLVGFSNSGVASVAILFMVAEGVNRTSVLGPFIRLLLGKPKSMWVAQVRLIVPLSFLSAIVHNTPMVALLIPIMQQWCRRAGYPVGKFLMPANNGVVLGGCLSLLGTSTNLIVSGLVEDKTILDKDGNRVVLSIFGIAPVALPAVVGGLIFILLTTNWLLPERSSDSLSAIIKNPREYTVPLLVTDKSPIVSDTIASAGLRNLTGLFLIEITREDGTVIQNVSPDTQIMANDVLLFAGVVETVTELYLIPGVVAATNQSSKMTYDRHRRRLVELVISASSRLAGRTAKQIKFRSRFDSVIIAVHRSGEHIKEKIGDIVLRPGDTLLVEAGKTFIQHYGKDSNFALVSEVAGSQPFRSDNLHKLIAVVTFTAMTAVASSGHVDLVTAAAVATVVLIATHCVTAKQAARAVNLRIMLTIAASFGLSNGLDKTGAAEELASAIVDLFKNSGSLGILFGIFIASTGISAFLTNNAAVTLLFPVVVNIIEKNNLNPYAGLYVLMMGGSCSFFTHIGYQTNLMVHGPGGYTFMDWIRNGVPLTIVAGVASVIAANYIHPSP